METKNCLSLLSDPLNCNKFKVFHDEDCVHNFDIVNNGRI